MPKQSLLWKWRIGHSDGHVAKMQPPQHGNRHKNNSENDSQQNSTHIPQKAPLVLILEHLASSALVRASIFPHCEPI
jgi:hypothetical protein